MKDRAAGPVRCVLFDLDGTLVDTAPDLGHAANLVRAEQGLRPLPIEAYRPVASAGARGLLRIALGLAPTHADFPARRDRLLELYQENIARESVLFEGLDPFLRRLESSGRSWGVVTNKPGPLTLLLLDALQLRSRAACSLSPDAQTPAKPAPDLLLKACAGLGLSPVQCVYVGDDRRDIDAARAAAMPAIAADWGYLGEGGPIESWGADFIARTPADLDGLIA